MGGVVHERSIETTPTTPEGVLTTETSPMASVGLTGILMRRQRFEVAVTVGSTFGLVLNPFTGRIQKRLQWLSALNVRREKTVLSVTLNGAQTYPTDDPSSFSLVGLGFILTQELSKLISLSGGFANVWQLTAVSLELCPISGTRSLAYL